MLIFKKAIFALPFLIFLVWFFYNLNFFFKDPYLIFGFDTAILLQLVWLLVSLSLASFCFVIFAALSDDWKFILPVSILGSLTSFALFSIPSGLVMWVGTLLSLCLTYLILSNKLKNYLTFQASSLLNPSIKSLATFLILTASLAFYIASSTQIKEQGFKIPDSLIDTALKFTTSQLPDVQGESIAQVSLTPEQIELLKQNPDVLKQYGIDPDVLDSQDKQSSVAGPTKPSTSPPSNDLVKNLLQIQIQNIVKPYENLIPIFLAGLFFVTMQSLFSLLAVTLTPLIALTFWIFTKTNFIRFETEMREVKKLVV